MISAKDVMNKIEDIACSARKPTAMEALYDLLLKALSPMQKKVYDLAVAEKEISSLTCREKFDISLSHAGNVLKQLKDLGLIVSQWDDERHVKKYRVRANFFTEPYFEPERVVRPGEEDPFRDWDEFWKRE